MTKQYPFFREEDEETLAVIGEEAVAADLNGTYHKPYAVLTKKRLYCKNEAGNFITETGALKSAKKGLLPGLNWFLWGMVVALLLMVVGAGMLSFDVFTSYRDSRLASAQYEIDDYLYCESQSLPGWEKGLERYKAAEKQLELDRKEWEEKEYDKVRQNAGYANDQLEVLKAEASDYKGEIGTYQYEVDRFDRDLERIPGDLEHDRNYLIGLQNASIRRPNDSFLRTSIQGTQKLIDANEKRYNVIMSQAEQDKIEGYRQKLTELRAKLEETEASIKKYQKEVAEYEKQLAAMSELEADIEANQSIVSDRDGNYTKFEELIEKHKTEGKDRYQAAEKVVKKMALMRPCFIAMAAVFLLLVVLAALKRVKTAVTASWALVGLCVAFFWSSGLFDAISYSSAPGSGPVTVPAWQAAYWGVKTFVLVMLVCGGLSLLLGLLALFLNRKRTMYQITHTTGVFHFTPSQYPAAEFKNFTAQVEELKAGEPAHA